MNQAVGISWERQGTEYDDEIVLASGTLNYIIVFHGENRQTEQNDKTSFEIDSA